MSETKLFKLVGPVAHELTRKTIQLEKSLQTVMERNLDTLLGVHFLQSEYSTGKTHGGRIDTLGLDENGCPVIVEYKRAVNENVINQDQSRNSEFGSRFFARRTYDWALGYR
ncbi:MAG: hypothetical protein ABFD50_13520 [Smithella sp.]